VRIVSAAQRMQIVRAGRLAFTVDLGSAHSLEEDTPAEQAAAASDPCYFVTRAVRFEPLDD
jgi:hypothetical protein